MTKLAIDGGKRTVPEGAIKPWPPIGQMDRDAVLRVFDNQMLCGAGAPETVALQKEWAEYVGRKHCLATNSGTAALHMSLAAAQIGVGDEVIVPAYTFLASASCILHANSIPIFVDIDERTYNIDVSKIEEKVTERTKAILPVHLHGLPADLDEILAIAKKHNLIVIEDACQAHGAEYKGKKVGSFGEMAAFSQNSSKNLCGGEGGFFVTDDDTYMMRGDMLRMFGDEIDDETQLRVYNASILGYMYRTQELPAAFTRSQLKRLDENNAIRQKNCAALTEILSGYDWVTTPYVPSDRTHVYWMYIARFDPKKAGVDLSPREFRVALEKALHMEGVLVGQWQIMPVPAQDLFQTKTGHGKGFPWNSKFYDREITYDVADYPVASALCEDYTVIVGTNPPNGSEMLERYAEAIHKVFGDLDTVVKHKDDDIVAHFSGSIFMAA
ncbi:MAG: DegT/DnrJ/EryC1/StrS family aminotransferase [Ardenticatenia bacterium]|nr:DegT/DnrJ/EryC1/StrS family aminotransferase [Ardenticatenia bacterium]